MVEEIINDLMEELKDSGECLIKNGFNNLAEHKQDYDNGYYDGYHDALVGLMNKLHIKHHETFRVKI